MPPSIVLAREWDDEMVDWSGDLYSDRGYEHEDPEFEWTEEDFVQFEQDSIEAEYERQEVPSWAELFGFEGGFKCRTFYLFKHERKANSNA